MSRAVKPMRGPKAAVKVPMEMRAKIAPHTEATFAPETPLRVRSRSWRMTAHGCEFQLSDSVSQRCLIANLPTVRWRPKACLGPFMHIMGRCSWHVCLQQHALAVQSK